MKPRATAIDAHVGKRISLYRRANDLSQTKLGQRAGVSQQMVQKYEDGINRVSAGRLFQFSKILDVPVDAFFEGAEAA